MRGVSIAAQRDRRRVLDKEQLVAYLALLARLHQLELSLPGLPISESAEVAGLANRGWRRHSAWRSCRGTGCGFRH